MEHESKLRGVLLRCCTASVVTVALLLLCVDVGAIIYTHGVKLRVLIVRASKEGGATVKVGQGISRSVKSALIRRYKLKYKTYTKIDEDTRQVRFGRHEVYDLPDDKQMDLVIESHRQRILNFKIQIGYEIQMVKMIHGKHWLLQYGDKTEPVIIVFTPHLLQTTRKP